MKSIGNILILDSVSSMNRDRVNFEDRILYNTKYRNKDKRILSRTISAKTAPSCLDLLRKRGEGYRQFVDGLDEVRAYIILGLAEENHAISKKWFDVTIHHLIDELFYMGVEPCIVSCRKKIDRDIGLEKIHDGRKEIYTSKPNWNQTSCYSLNMISKQRNIDIIKCDISCNKQWNTISVESVKLMSKLISDDLNYYINN